MRSRSRLASNARCRQDARQYSRRRPTFACVNAEPHHPHNPGGTASPF
ncbi:hypothetical protein ACFQ7O_35600 [Streptomyces sp. NPDC056485]